FFSQGLEPDGGDKLTSSLFLVGPEVRYYFDVNTVFKVYVKGGASFGQAKVKDNNSESTTDLVQFGGGAGAAIFPTRNFSVNLGLNLNGLNTTSNEGIESTDNYFGGGFDVGFSVFFGGNRGE
ncbi:MAG: outer membrane beta-barrel protein, partial [Saprospiraceae bacterium]